MGENLDNEFLLAKILRIPARQVIRKEWFGALIFDRASLAVMEINENTLNLINFVDGKKTIQEIAKCFVRTTGFQTDEVLTFLKNLLDRGILEC